MNLTRWMVVGVVALIGSISTGLGAAYLREGGWEPITFWAFSVMTLVPFGGLALFFVAEDQDPPEHHEDSVETEWAHRASAGAFLDLFVLLGLSTAITNVGDLPGLDSAVYLAFAMVDFALRYFTLKRRES